MKAPYKSVLRETRRLFRNHGIAGNVTDRGNLYKLQQIAGIPTTPTGKFKRHLEHVVKLLNPKFVCEPDRPVKKQPKPTKKFVIDQYQDFYASYAWRQLRMITLKRYGRKCMCCQATDVVINVDHIKPLRKYWHLRLDPENLQVLCGPCNHGKGNWDETDWRPRQSSSLPRLKLVKREER